MTALLREVRQNIGPDKLILVDGFLYLITEEGWKYADYGVAQSYGAYSPDNLQERFDNLKNRLPANRFIITENFESIMLKGESTIPIRSSGLFRHWLEWLTGIRQVAVKEG